MVGSKFSKLSICEPEMIVGENCLKRKNPDVPPDSSVDAKGPAPKHLKTINATETVLKSELIVAASVAGPSSSSSGRLTANDRDKLSAQALFPETKHESMDIDESSNSPSGITPRVCAVQAQLDSTIFDFVLGIFPGIERNFVNAEYAKWEDTVIMVEKIVEMGDYPKTNEDLVSLPYYTEQLTCLMNVFPDADEKFLQEKSKLDKIEFEQFVHETLQNNMYPRKKSDGEKLKNSEPSDNDDVELFTTRFNVENFLRVIPDPFGYYMDDKRVCTRNQHGWQFLKKRYSNKGSYYSKEINEVYSKHRFNLTLTCKHLDANKPKSKKLKGTSHHELRMPQDVNKPFLKEACFIEHQAEIRAHLVKEAEAKNREFQQAKENEEVIECTCCCEEATFNNCVACPNGHLFCVQCVQKSSEIRIGEGLTDFPCLAACGAEFSLQLLGNLMNPRMFSKVLKQIQISEVKAANVEGLEDCPFCEFATIPPPDTRIFTCLNPECLKESCRECRRPSHIPLRCDEVENDAQTEARKLVEEEMTKALVRECYRCKKPFIKIDGCNKMSCSCGALMCYVCRQPVSDYSHFNGQGGTDLNKCPLYSTDKLLHVDAVKVRAKQAMKEVDVKLVFDPTKILPDASTARNDLPFGIVEDEQLVLHRAVGAQPRQPENNYGGARLVVFPFQPQNAPN